MKEPYWGKAIIQLMDIQIEISKEAKIKGR